MQMIIAHWEKGEKMSNKITEVFPLYPSPFKTSDGVEFVPVVRCKDCKWCSVVFDRLLRCGNTFHDDYVYSDEFCCYGERR